ncbi:platelet glycoprotein Ib alpha chain-like [Rana temporaria]|uniref:platelet glycoprotein Ib alpha chain-like n=1 Tax=Rana temporaria TaxID=8407 RepID=UPI001AAC90B2|nr:platelet glycoprotein Ib alpha chain-like [Rana temporaria]
MSHRNLNGSIANNGVRNLSCNPELSVKETQLLVVKQSSFILMKLPAKKGAGPDVKKTIALPAVPQAPDTTTAAVPTPPLTPDTTAATVPTLPPTPDTTAATVPTLPPTPNTTSTVPDEHLNIVKRDLGEGISTSKSDANKKGGPKDPVVIVSGTAIKWLVKLVTPCKTNTVQKP